MLYEIYYFSPPSPECNKNRTLLSPSGKSSWLTHLAACTQKQVTVRWRRDVFAGGHRSKWLSARIWLQPLDSGLNRHEQIGTNPNEIIYLTLINDWFSCLYLYTCYSDAFDGHGFWKLQGMWCLWTFRPENRFWRWSLFVAQQGRW